VVFGDDRAQKLEEAKGGFVAKDEVNLVSAEAIEANVKLVERRAGGVLFPAWSVDLANGLHGDDELESHRAGSGGPEGLHAGARSSTLGLWAAFGEWTRGRVVRSSTWRSGWGSPGGSGSPKQIGIRQLMRQPDWPPSHDRTGTGLPANSCRLESRAWRRSRFSCLVSLGRRHTRFAQPTPSSTAWSKHGRACQLGRPVRGLGLRSRGRPCHA